MVSYRSRDVVGARSISGRYLPRSQRQTDSGRDPHSAENVGLYTVGHDHAPPVPCPTSCCGLTISSKRAASIAPDFSTASFSVRS